jgi:hypothetical protein
LVCKSPRLSSSYALEVTQYNREFKTFMEENPSKLEYGKQIGKNELSLSEYLPSLPEAYTYAHTSVNFEEFFVCQSVFYVFTLVLYTSTNQPYRIKKANLPTKKIN